MALLLVTHDLGVVAERADDVAIMYAGRIVERGAVADVLPPRRCIPYTRGLLRSIPQVGARRQRRLEAIPGSVPDLTAPAERLPLPRPLSACAIARVRRASIRRCEHARAGHAAACIRVEPTTPAACHDR